MVPYSACVSIALGLLPTSPTVVEGSGQRGGGGGVGSLYPKHRREYDLGGAEQKRCVTSHCQVWKGQFSKSDSREIRQAEVKVRGGVVVHSSFFVLGFEMVACTRSCITQNRNSCCVPQSAFSQPFVL